MIDRIENPIVRERAKLETLKPTLDAFKGMKGFRHQVKRDKDGKVLRQRYRFKANDHGKLTPQAEAVRELHKPYWESKLALEARLRNLPGDYGLKGMSGGVYAADVQGVWCPRCDRRKAWCECP